MLFKYYYCELLVDDDIDTVIVIITLINVNSPFWHLFGYVHQSKQAHTSCWIFHNLNLSVIQAFWHKQTTRAETTSTTLQQPTRFLKPQTY